MHMHKEHNGAAPVQKSCDMCSFNSHLSHILKNPIDRKHLGIVQTFEYDKCDFSAKLKGSIKRINGGLVQLLNFGIALLQKKIVLP